MGALYGLSLARKKQGECAPFFDCKFSILRNFGLEILPFFRRAVLVKEPEEIERQPVDVIPREFAARTLVHEYGGGAFSVYGNAVIFSNYKDQRLYRQDIGGNF